jgi:hypothetical protein
MRVGRRRVAVVATVLVALAAGSGVARAYFAPGSQDLSSAAGYFTFCADRQRDTAGITATDLGAAPTGADYRIDNFVYDQPGPLVGGSLASTDAFVLGKSGIHVNGVDRRVVTTQRIEYVDASHALPAQVRCKMRTRESLVRPPSEVQRFDNGTPSTVPWGFGPQAATGTAKSCRTVQDELVSTVWASLTAAQQAAATYKYGTSSLVLGPTSLSTTGTQWTLGEKIVTAAAGTLTIADRSLDAPVGTPNPIGDRILGAYYCTFVAPDYIRSIFLGGPVA